MQGHGQVHAQQGRRCKIVKSIRHTALWQNMCMTADAIPTDFVRTKLPVPWSNIT